MCRFSAPLLLAVSIAACGPAAPPPTPPDYVPSAPFAYDGRYLDGSFEARQGTGWDTCFTRTPGTTEDMATGGSEGTAYLAFESGGCAGGCSPQNPSTSQAYLWFSKSTDTSAAMGLYFDIKNMGGGTPTGTLSFYGTDNVCEEETLLAAIPLDQLALWSEWSTRCVDVVATGAHAGIGLAVTGGSHRIGLDALRLGPICHP